MSMPRPAPPYSRLAPHYERFIGRLQLGHARRNFEQAVRRNRLRFSCAADLGCGPGLFARYLTVRWGVPVFAVDRSPEMLAITACRGRGLSIVPLLQDLRRLELPWPVDLITMLSFTLNLFRTVNARSEVLRGMWRNLAPGGYGILDCLTPRQALLAPRSSGVVMSRLLDRGPRHFCLGIRVGGTEERHCAQLVVPRELLEETEAAGFRFIDALDYLTSGPVRRASPAVVCVVQKPASCAG